MREDVGYFADYAFGTTEASPLLMKTGRSVSPSVGATTVQKCRLNNTGIDPSKPDKSLVKAKKAKVDEKVIDIEAEEEKAEELYRRKFKCQAEYLYNAGWKSCSKSQMGRRATSSGGKEDAKEG